MNDTFFRKATPGQAGIPAGRLLDFLTTLENKRFCMHSVMVVKNGMQVLDAYYKPFGPEFKHRMYSVSKSIVSIAVGILAGEGKVSLDDTISKYFPDLLPKDPHPFIMKATVRDLLCMASVHSRNTYTMYSKGWVASHFQTEPTHLPGKIFFYDTSATVTLTAMVERVTGMPFLEYLRPRLLDPIGVSKDIKCIKTPDGYSWGGSGVICTPLDLAKIAYVCMHMGKYKDKQLIPRDYLEKATTRQIDTSLNFLGDPGCGYGYQIWITPYDGFAFKGMGGQVALCLPKYDTMLITTADAQEKGNSYDVIIQTFLEKVFPYLDTPLPESEEADQAALEEYCANLSVLVEEGSYENPRAKEFSGREFKMYPNDLGITHLRLDFDNDSGRVCYRNATGDHVLEFGIGWNKPSVFPETHYFGDQISVPKGEGYKCLTSAAWLDENVLSLCCYAVDDYFGTLRMKFNFGENDITVYMVKVAEAFFDEYQGFASGHME